MWAKSLHFRAAPPDADPGYRYPKYALPPGTPAELEVIEGMPVKSSITAPEDQAKVGRGATSACSTAGLDADTVIDRILKTLLATKIPLGRLDGDVAQQELDLVQFPSGIAAQARASPSEIMRGQIINARFPGTVLYDMPYDPLRYSGSPGLACAANAPKHAAFADPAGGEPEIDGVFDPIRNGHRSNVAALAEQVDNGPVIIAPLEMSNVQFCRLFPAQPTTQEDAEERSVSFALESIRVWHLPERSPGRR